MTQDFSRRMAIVVRKDIEPWQATNTIAHIAAKLGRAAEQFETGESFITNEGFAIPRNSQYPIIVFQTEGAEKLRSLLTEIRANNLPYLAYIREMIDFESDEELQAAVGQKKESELEYLGVGAFGDNDLLKKLTKKFSLWK
jgi:hypothetical protein